MALKFGDRATNHHTTTTSKHSSIIQSSDGELLEMGIWRFRDIGNSGRCHGHRHDDDDNATTTTITPNIIHCIIGCNGSDIGSSDPWRSGNDY